MGKHLIITYGQHVSYGSQVQIELVIGNAVSLLAVFDCPFLSPWHGYIPHAFCSAKHFLKHVLIFLSHLTFLLTLM